MSSTNPPRDPFDNLIRDVKATLQRNAEHAALAAKVANGTATHEEWMRWRFWSNTDVRSGVVVTTARELTVEEWKEAVARQRSRGKPPSLLAPEEKPKSE